MFLYFFSRYLFSSKSISLVRFVSTICILGFAVSLSGLIIVISVMSGFGLSTQKRLLAEEPHLIIYANESEDRDLFFSSVKKKLDSDKILTHRFFETQDVVLKNSKGRFIGAVAKGYLQTDLLEFVKPYENFYQEEVNQNVGEVSFKDIEKQNWNSSVYLSFDLSHSLSLYPGDAFYIIPIENLLLPITEMSPPEKVYLQDSLMFSNDKTSRTLFYKMDSFDSLKQTASLSYGVEVFLKEAHNFLPYQKKLENDFKVESWKQRHSSLFLALKLEKYIMAILLFLAIMISSFSISSMTRLLLAQKRNDMVILMVMGWSTQKIRNLFLKISLFLSFVGMILGLCIAGFVCLFLKSNRVPFFPDIYYGGFIPVEINIFVFVFSALATFLLAFFISWLSVYSYTLPSSFNLKKST